MIQKSTLTVLTLASIAVLSVFSFFNIESYKTSIETKRYVAEEIQCMTRNIYFEAAHEPFEGKLAVAQVTINRTKNPNFPSTVCAVVSQKTGNLCQFSWFCEPAKPIQNDFEWKESELVAKQILTKQLTYDKMSDALFYHAVYIKTDWDRRYQKVKQIGNHIFYKLR